MQISFVLIIDPRMYKVDENNKKKYHNCRELFCPDSHNGNRQHFCKKKECRKASKADSQKRWVEKPENNTPETPVPDAVFTLPDTTTGGGVAV